MPNGADGPGYVLPSPCAPTNGRMWSDRRSCELCAALATCAQANSTMAKVPNSKPQVPRNLQAPNLQAGSRRVWRLVIGISLEFGVWDWVLSSQVIAFIIRIKCLWSSVHSGVPGFVPHLPGCAPIVQLIVPQFLISRS